ncbi:hypothetical protein TWF481_006621 [Arthrobotrys musiformis]|uniref:Uncharacterized protein n=1 Tax=Arthrobotrys musiformis TaxID=47236 RepID=A0AAV9W926_9PEZI
MEAAEGIWGLDDVFPSPQNINTGKRLARPRYVVKSTSRSRGICRRPNPFATHPPTCKARFIVRTCGNWRFDGRPPHDPTQTNILIAIAIITVIIIGLLKTKRTRNTTVLILFRIFAIGYLAGLLALMIFGAPPLFYAICYGGGIYALLVAAKLTAKKVFETVARDDGAPVWLRLIANDLGYVKWIL